MSIYFTYNDKVYEEGTPVITPDSRALKYGDGIFETIKLFNGSIQLATYHFDRLFSGLKLLQFEIPEHFTRTYLENKILELSKMNGHPFARTRLMVFRGKGSLYDAEDHLPNYIIQSWSIEPAEKLNSTGLNIDVYPDAKKVCDKFANLKNNNFLPYVMAALYSKQIETDDCIVLNNYDRLCDTTIANIFIIKENVISTPALSEGCVAGVMRRALIEKMLQSGYKIIEKAISIEELSNADEVFLTNSVKGIQWVKQFRNKVYKNELIQEISRL